MTAAGLTSLARGPASQSLSQLVLSLNTHSSVPASSLASLLLSCPQLRVLELGGAGQTKSLYFQGGDAKRRHGVYSSVLELLRERPGLSLGLSRVLVFLESDRVENLGPLVSALPGLQDLTLFSWEQVRLARTGWAQLVSRLVRLEIVGLGFTSSTTTSTTTSTTSTTSGTEFDVKMLEAAVSLRRLEVAGWGDTRLEVDRLLATLPHLESLYLEDLKLALTEPSSPPHQLSRLVIFHCSTSQLDLVQALPSLLPSLQSLTISSLYRDDPTRGLPFHFHLPRPEDPQERQERPLVDLKMLAGLRELESLHLNVSYPVGQLELEQDNSLATLLIKADWLTRGH